jgi:ABC-type multidrug transport system ATPase subunit
VIELLDVSASKSAGRGRPRAALRRVSFQHRSGVLAIVGAERDGTALLGDLLDGTVRPERGRVLVAGAPAGEPHARSKVARVPLDAPLPELLRVDEVCALSAELRGEREPADARTRLAALGCAELASRRIETLSLPERRTIAIAIALTGSATVIAIDEPLAVLASFAPRLAIEAIRAKGREAAIVVTTASSRDATALADELAILTSGAYATYASAEVAAGGGRHEVRLVVSKDGRRGAGVLAAALGERPEVRLVETSAYRGEAAIALTVSGSDPLVVARVVGEAIARTGVDVDRIESTPLPADAVRAALAVRAASPPPGSLPPPALPPSGRTDP